MARHKLVLESEFEEPYTLLAMHCSEEPYKVAFLMNRYLNTRFRRRRLDIDLKEGGMMLSFPIFDFTDPSTHSQYYLVANKCRVADAALQSSDGLFAGTESLRDHFLLPEYKKVDFLLKIYSDFERISLPDFVSRLNGISQIISAYPLEPAYIKSKNNLIFD